MGKTYNRKNTHVFAGLLTCGCCGRNMSATSNGRELKGGYRPSIYACMSHRKNTGCTNKYVSDIVIGPFVLNYIANIMKARESFGKSTSPQTLQKKLLRGDMFQDVVCIKEAGLMELYSLYKSEVTGIQYTIKSAEDVEGSTTSERDVLLSEKRRIERALSRLKSLYLYSEEEMSEKDYILERKALTDQLEQVDARLNQISKALTSELNMSDEELFEATSYFFVSQRLADKRFVDYKRLLKETDPHVLKDFINSVTTNFCIENGRIRSITLRNGIINEFVYTDD